MSRYYDLFARVTQEQERSLAQSPSVLPDPVHPPVLADDWGLDVPLNNLVDTLFYSAALGPVHRVVFSSIDRREGTSTIAAHVADCLARRTSGTVCIVDANLRTPAQHDIFGVENHHGLTDFAAMPNAGVHEFARQLSDSNLWLLSCGSAKSNSADMASPERIARLLDQICKEFDFVVVDAPPLGRFRDAQPLALATDGLVLVIRAHATRRASASLVKEQLDNLRVRILGTVLNRDDSSQLRALSTSI